MPTVKFTAVPYVPNIFRDATVGYGDDCEEAKNNLDINVYNFHGLGMGVPGQGYFGGAPGYENEFSSANPRGFSATYLNGYIYFSFPDDVPIDTEISFLVFRSVGYDPCIQQSNTGEEFYYVKHVDGETYQTEYTVPCLTLLVNAFLLSSTPVSGTSPLEYRHLYLVQAIAGLGTPPFTYDWSTTAGTFTPSVPTGDTCLLTVTNTNPNGATGTVTCTVEDSGSCSAADSADLAASNGPFEGPVPCVPQYLLPETCECEETCNKTEVCVQPTGNNPVGSGSGGGPGSGGPGGGGPGGGSPGGGGPGGGCGGGKGKMSASRFYAGGGSGPSGPCGPSGPGGPTGVPSPFGKPTTTRPGVGLN